MTNPRQVFAGATLAVALKCSEGRFFLRPGSRQLRKLRFLLAHYADKHGIELHGFVFMSNHFHLVLTDPRRRLPRFMEEFDSMVARVLNNDLGRSGKFWEATPYRSWLLETPAEVLEHLVYLATNPVSAYLVRHPNRWPGLISLPTHVGTTQEVRPPLGGLFGRRSKSTLPKRATLRLPLPPHFEDLHRFRRLFEQALQLRLAELHARPGTYAGRDSVKRRDPFSAPASAAGGPSFSLLPALTNATKEKRQGLTRWRQGVRDAYYRWLVDKTTRFPRGTYRVVVHYKARLVS